MAQEAILCSRAPAPMCTVARHAQKKVSTRQLLALNGRATTNTVQSVRMDYSQEWILASEAQRFTSSSWGILRRSPWRWDRQAFSIAKPIVFIKVLNQRLATAVSRVTKLVRNEFLGCALISPFFEISGRLSRTVL
jgi:hypothetical protein